MKDPRMAEEQIDWLDVGSIPHPETVPNKGLQYAHQMFEWDLTNGPLSKLRSSY